MNASGWARVKSLFLRARDSSVPNQVLESTQPQTAEEVRRLLAATEQTASLRIDGRAHEETNAPQSLFEPEVLVASRFRIVRLLGRGGMGEVYEAIDTLRDTPIALKVLRPDPAVPPQVTERLLRKEVSLAQLISHKNICRIHDLYPHQPPNGPPILVISMELLSGTTLGEMLAARGRLTPQEILPLARQLADGIDAAHSAGVVHRDLKPSNVMLVHDGEGTRLVVTDFGLARAQRAGQSIADLTRAVAGTLRYMSPEQLQGRADHRSDVYSCSTILYEMLTAKLPFAGETDLAIALNRLSLAPRDPGTIIPTVPLNWRVTLLQGLSREPQHRPQSAGQLVGGLESPQRAAFLPFRLIFLRWRGLRSWLLWAMPIAITVLGLVRFFSREPPPESFPPFSRLLIQDLDHATTTDKAILGANLSLSAAIAQSPHLEAARPADLAETLARMGVGPGQPLDPPSMRQLALRTTQGAILSGSITKARGYVLHLKLEAVSSEPRYTAASTTRDFRASDDTALFGAIGSAAHWVRKLSGEGTRELNEQNARLEDLTTPSWDALNLLQEAGVRRDENDPRGALVFATEALEIDHDFAAAESLRGDLFTQLRLFKEGFTAHKRALGLIKKRNVKGRERYRIESAYEVDAGDNDASLQTYVAWIAHFPNDYLPHFYMAYLQYHRAEYPTALREMQRAQELNPSFFAIYPHLATYYLANGDLQGAERCAKSLRDKGEPGWASEVEGQILLARGRFDEAAAKIRPLVGLRDDVFSSVAPVYLANALADSGRFEAAESALSTAGESDMRRGAPSQRAERQVAIGYLRWLRHDTAGASAAIRPNFRDLDNPDSISFAGAVLARSGDIAGARAAEALLSQWPSIPLVAAARSRLTAEIAIASRSNGASALVKEVDARFPSPLALEFLYHAALELHQTKRLSKLRGQILQRKDVLLEWADRKSPLGLYWLASCSGLPVTTTDPRFCGTKSN